jgi:hypothetical protein
MQTDREDEFSRYLRLRWTRGDGDRYVRHDAARYLKPEYPEKKYAPSHAYPPADPPTDWSEADELTFRCELASLRVEFELLRLSLRAQKALHHSNFQPRVPAGNPDGGQFAPGRGQFTQLAQLGNTLPGISGSAGGPRGHHYFPKALFTVRGIASCV